MATREEIEWMLALGVEVTSAEKTQVVQAGGQIPTGPVLADLHWVSAEEAEDLPDFDVSLILSAEAREELAGLRGEEPIDLLASLEASGAEQEIGPDDMGVEFGDDDIEFDQPDPRRASPNPRVRFQVGREDPRRTPFTRDIRPGYGDGEVVRARGANGSWGDRVSPNAPPPRQAPSQVSSYAPARPAPTTAAAAGPKVSVYDHMVSSED